MREKMKIGQVHCFQLWHNSSHKTKYHCHFIWCCKANFKINLSRLETKQNELCSHIYKYSNCKDDHQADSNQCLFWKHCFNREWYSKKYKELHKSGRQSIYLDVNSSQAWLWRKSRSSLKTFERTSLSSTLF